MNTDFLVLEDDPTVARLTVRALRPFGSVVSASTCDEARRLILETPPLGLVVDWDLPDGEGIDVAAWAVREMKVGHVLVLERFALRVLSAQPERKVLVKIQDWRQRYRLDETETAVLGISVLGFDKTRAQVDGKTYRASVRKILAKTGDSELTTAVARLHLEIRDGS
jgi:CheY-like chemotaxis protein